MTTADEQRTRPMDAGASCQFCPGQSFRRSRLKARDVPALLLLRYPVRCLSCSQRQIVSLPVARRALASSFRQVKAAKAPSWNGWDGVGMARPGTVGGTAFPPLPVRVPKAMPELRGVRLNHFTSSPIDPDETRAG